MFYVNIRYFKTRAFIDMKVFKFAVIFIMALNQQSPSFSMTRTKCYFLKKRAAGSGKCQTIHQEEGGQEAKTSLDCLGHSGYLTLCHKI